MPGGLSSLLIYHPSPLQFLPANLAVGQHCPVGSEQGVDLDERAEVQEKVDQGDNRHVADGALVVVAQEDEQVNKGSHGYQDVEEAVVDDFQRVDVEQQGKDDAQERHQVAEIDQRHHKPEKEPVPARLA